MDDVRSPVPRAPAAELDVAVVDDGLPPLRVWSAVAVAADGTLWAGIPQSDRALDTSDARALDRMAPDGGVVRRTPDGRWTWFPFHPQRTAGPARSTVADLAVLPDGRLVIAHGRRGNTDVALTIHGPAADDWSAVRSVGPIGAVADGPRTGQVMQLAVAVEPGGGFSLWLATWSRGVYRWRDGRWTAFSRTDQGEGIVPAPGLCSDQVWAIAAAADAVWAACVGRSGEEGLGVSRFDRAAETWQRIGPAEGLPTGTVTAIAAVAGGAFLGTDEPTTRHSGGLGVVPLKASAAGVTIEPPLSTFADGRTPPANEVTALAFDPTGRLWVGTRGAGLAVYDPRDGRWRSWTAASTDDGLAGDAVTDVLVKGDDVWVASTRSRHAVNGPSDGGLTLIDRASGTVRRTIRPSAGGLPSGQPSSLALGVDGRVYVGFGAATGGVGIDVQQGSGVAAYDPAADVWAMWRRGSGGLVGDTVLDLASGAEGIWAAVSYAPDGTSAARLTGGGATVLHEDAWLAWQSGDFGFVSYRDGEISGDVRSVHEAADGAVGGQLYARGRDRRRLAECRRRREPLRPVAPPMARRDLPAGRVDPGDRRRRGRARVARHDARSHRRDLAGRRGARRSGHRGRSAGSGAGGDLAWHQHHRAVRPDCAGEQRAGCAGDLGPGDRAGDRPRLGRHVGRRDQRLHRRRAVRPDGSRPADRPGSQPTALSGVAAGRPAVDGPRGCRSMARGPFRVLPEGPHACAAVSPPAGRSAGAS
ncbi:MAG: hypothetical protein IPG72_05885 [Ardenticatenales bacterium]|nr:hypothetical protein [Ardenticatenales bacterium]